MSEISSICEVLMPPLPRAITDGKLERWHVSEGQRIAPGDVLAEIATPGATIEIEAEREGRIERILVPAGTAGIKVNTPIALLFAERETSAQGHMPGVSALPVEGVTAPRLEIKPALVQTYREALRDALAEAMRADERVILFGSDLAQNRGAQKATQGLLEEFGSARVVTVPALEDAAFHLAIGAAMAGLRPVLELTSWPRAMVEAHAAIVMAAEIGALTGGAISLPLVLRGPNGFVPGLTGQAAQCVAASLAQIEGLKVVVPATPGTAKALLAAAIREDGPVAVLEHELLYASSGPVGGHEERDAVIGRARIARKGRDITIVTYGVTLRQVSEAARQLEGEGISAEVVDLMTLRPLDVESVVVSVQRTGRLLTVEEGHAELGVGAEIIAAVSERAFSALTTPPRRLTRATGPMAYSSALQNSALPNADNIRENAKALMRPSN